MTIRIIDTETTGLSPLTDKVVQIASVDLTRDGIENAMKTLVALPEGRDLPPSASGVHHIVAEDLVGAPDFETARARFMGADVYVAHNMEFDNAFLRLDKSVPTICTLKCALRLWPDLPNHKNQTVRYHLGLISVFGVPRRDIHPHDALSDVMVTAAILKEMLALASYQQLLAWSQEPQLHTRFNFGKFIGRPMVEHASYLRWMLSGTEMDEGRLFSAKYWLPEAEQIEARQKAEKSGKPPAKRGRPPKPKADAPAEPELV